MDVIGKGSLDMPRPTSPVQEAVGKGGRQRLAPSLRADIEGRLGADFSDVRIHIDDQAAKSAEAVSAEGYTVGNELKFGQGYFEPASPAGRRRLVHELVHVQQQRKGPVSGTNSGSGVAISDPSDSFEQEAEATAARIVSSLQLVGGRSLHNIHHGWPPTRRTAARSVQRCGGMPCDCANDEEDAVQRSSIDAPSPQAVQRAMVCPVGVDPDEGTGCYEAPDTDLPNNGISSQPANDNAAAEDLSQPVNDNATTGDLSEAANDNAPASSAEDLAAAGAEAAEVGEAEIAEGIIEAGLAAEAEPGIGTIIGTALIIGAGYLAYKYLTRFRE